VSVEKKIPKAAVKPLIEHCQRLSIETGKPEAQVFKELLELTKKYADYFFSGPWPEKLDEHFEFSDVDFEFIQGSAGYGEECERFTVVCLKRNISLEGFDADGFNEDFRFYGNRPCWNCVVTEAARLRKEIKRLEEDVKKNEEAMKMQEPSYVTRSMYEYNRRPDVVRRHKMMYIELRLYEELGQAEGKGCEVKNKYKCPYGEEAKELIECGRLAKFVWRQIQWYDTHWNPSENLRPAANEMKWYHYGEPSLIDVTSYDDVLKAATNGRLKKIIEERKKYEQEYER
jgi:hypothetical protein